MNSVTNNLKLFKKTSEETERFEDLDPSRKQIYCLHAAAGETTFTLQRLQVHKHTYIRSGLLFSFWPTEKSNTASAAKLSHSRILSSNWSQSEGDMMSVRPITAHLETQDSIISTRDVTVLWIPERAQFSLRALLHLDLKNLQEWKCQEVHGDRLLSPLPPPTRTPCCLWSSDMSLSSSCKERRPSGASESGDGLLPTSWRLRSWHFSETWPSSRSFCWQKRWFSPWYSSHWTVNNCRNKTGQSSIKTFAVYWLHPSCLD